MITYNPEEKKINVAIQQVYRDFALEYGRIQESELSESEKQAQINELIERATSTERILRSIRSLKELSDEDRADLGIEESKPTKVDTNVIDTLVSLYAKRAKMPSQRLDGIGILSNVTLNEGEELEDIDTTAFEQELRQYFTEHYADLLSDGFNDFLSDKTEVADDLLYKENGEIIQIAIKHKLDPKKFECFGYQLTIQDGLVAEEDTTLHTSHVLYASPEAINQRIYDLYSEVLFREKTSQDSDMIIRANRMLKNDYITYAQKQGIAIRDRDVLEEIPVDMKKVQGVAAYINRVLTKGGIISSDMTAQFAAEIEKDYSKIMNLSLFDFANLETVKSAIGDRYVPLFLRIEEDSIVKTEEYSPDIAYATPQYIRDEYKIVMARVRDASYIDAFSYRGFEVEKANKEKEALRRYIVENGIEGVDISIPETEVDHQKAEMIANAILSQYGENYEDKEGMQARLLQRIEERYPEMVHERQVISLDDLVGRELKEMGRGYVSADLYFQENFIYMGEISGFNGVCIYATPEELLQKIEVLDDKIATQDLAHDEERKREQLVKYARDNKLEIQIPDIEEIKRKKQPEQELWKGLSFLKRDVIPDDPTARAKIELTDTTFDVIYKISEGIPGAITGIMQLMEADENGLMLLLGLDDMNIRGSQIWEAYKYLYHEDGSKFAQAVANRDIHMVEFINQEMAVVGGEKAVTGGASFDRNKNPNKYRFTQAEVEQLKVQKEERIEKQRKAVEKMITSSPAKKNRGKKRQERERRKQEYRQSLIAKGKKSIAQLDTELTDLQKKEQEARKLYNEYAKQEEKPEEQL